MWYKDYQFFPPKVNSKENFIIKNGIYPSSPAIHSRNVTAHWFAEEVSMEPKGDVILTCRSASLL
jgi:hypothetical protein